MNALSDICMSAIELSFIRLCAAAALYTAARRSTVVHSVDLDTLAPSHDEAARAVSKLLLDVHQPHRVLRVLRTQSSTSSREGEDGRKGVGLDVDRAVDLLDHPSGRLQ